MISKRFILVLLLATFCSPLAPAQSRRRATAIPPVAPLAPPRPYTPPPLQSGSLDGNTFTHAQFGFALTLPDGWQVQDQEVKQQIVENAQPALDDASVKAKRTISAETVQNAMLLVALRPGEHAFNPSFTVVAENIAAALNVRTPEQYFSSMRNMMPESSPIRLASTSTADRVGDTTFGVTEASPVDPQSPVRQRYYVTIRRNHALAFILTYASDEQLKDCQEVLRTLKFQ